MSIHHKLELQDRIEALAAKQGKGPTTLLDVLETTNITTDVLVLSSITHHQIGQKTLTENDVQELSDKQIISEKSLNLVNNLFDHVDRNWKEGHSRITGLSDKHLSNLYLTGVMSLLEYGQINLLRLTSMLIEL